MSEKKRETLREICFKMFAFGLDFLKLGWEMFDSVVVTVTFFLDVLMPHSHSSTNGLGLFIILRLWRVARILNGKISLSDFNDCYFANELLS